MKKLLLLIFALGAIMTVYASAPDLTFNGKVLSWNTDFSRKQCGTLDISENLEEVSGIACSRVTPGYIWMQSDEVQKKIIATDELGTKRYMTVRFSKIIRWDWEDLSGGVYEGKNYLFIGAFGDNNETDGNYHIIYFEEPAIGTPNDITITPGDIPYVYPDGKNHNTEALMYDNKEQMIYIITKVYYDVCQVFSLPFRLDYTGTQTLKYVCDLGKKTDLGTGDKADHGFHLVTAADISPDGKYVLIKNQNNTTPLYSWILLWERQGDESISETLKRDPEPLKCYDVEWQGEAIAWLDDDTFYTTSDSQPDGDDPGDPPIYKYVRKPAPTPMVKRSFAIDGSFADWDDLTGLYRSEVGIGASLNKLYEMRCYADPAYLYYYLEYSGATGDVAYITFCLNHDNNADGFSIWFWSTPTLCMIQGSSAAMSSAGLEGIDPTPVDPGWPWTSLGVSDAVSSSAPGTLTNGHLAIEGKIALNKLPMTVTDAIKVGAYSSNSSWAEDGVLPDGDMLEVPVYKEPTGIENPHSEISSQKKIMDGQLIILRGNKMYNAEGKMIKHSK